MNVFTRTYNCDVMKTLIIQSRKLFYLYIIKQMVNKEALLHSSVSES